MGSASCCTSRGPPYPEGLSPRPFSETASRSRTEQSRSPPPMASWSTRFSKAEDAAELRAIFDDTMPHDDHDHGIMKSMKTKISSNTLHAVANAVTSKLRKHFSKDSAPSNRLSRSSVGNSEEEVERRKELRRLRDKRIQEELGMDNFDDDAASLSTVASSIILSLGVPSMSLAIPPHSKIPGGITSTSSDQTATSINMSQATTTVTSFKEIQKASIAKLIEASPKPLLIVKRRHSSVSVCKLGHFTGPTNIDCLPPWNTSYFDMPSGPILKPQRLPSITDPGIRRTSWRLSFASDQRSCQLRALVQDNDSPVKTGELSEAHPQHSAIKWLRGQGLRLSSQAFSEASEHASDLDNLRSHNPLCQGTSDFGGVDGNLEAQETPFHLWEMQISQRLASRGLYSHASSPQLSSWYSDSHHGGYSVASGGSKISAASRSRHCKTSSSGAIVPVMPKSWGNVVFEKTSSIHPSNINSSLPMPNSSRLDLPYYFARKISKPGQVDSFRVPEVALVRPDFSTIIPNVKANISTASLIVRASGSKRRLTVDSSNFTSETASFRQREDELNFIGTRFPVSRTSNGPSALVSSKFKEEFDISLPLPQAKSSIFSVLQLSMKAKRKAKVLPKSYSGALSLDSGRPPRSQGYGYYFAHRTSSSTASRRSNNGIRMEPTYTSQGNTVSPLYVSGKSATTMWGRSINRANKVHCEQVSSNLKTQRANPNTGSKKVHCSFIYGKRISEKLKGKQRVGSEDGKAAGSCASPAGERSDNDENMQIDQGLDIGLKDHEVGFPKLQVPETAIWRNSTSPTNKKQTERAATPQFWSRYLSHTRLRRSGPAGLSGNVYLRDLADTTGVEAEELTGYQGHATKEHNHGIPLRIRDKIRSSWYGVVASKMTSMNDPITSQESRSITSLGSTLKFAELEILPQEDGLKALKGVEKNVTVLTGREQSIQRMTANLNGRSRDEAAKVNEDVGDITEISIASPSFYADCVLHPQAEDAINDARSTRSRDTIISHPPTRHVSLDKEKYKREKYKTWSGRNRASAYFMGSMSMRRSTVDFTVEQEKLERFERDRAIKSAEEAWGGLP